VARKATRAFDLNSIVIDAHMHVGGDAVIPMQHSVSDDLMERFVRISNTLKSFWTEALHFLDNLFRFGHGLFNLIVNTALDRDRIKRQSLTRSFVIFRLVLINFDSGSLGKRVLRFVAE
jgi:hypothetical protein